MSRMLFSELQKIMVKKFTFVGVRGAIAPIAPPGCAPGSFDELLSETYSQHCHLRLSVLLRHNHQSERNSCRSQINRTFAVSTEGF